MPVGAGFELRHVVHLVRPWGQRAGDLEALRLGIASAPADVLFHHAVQYQLRDPGAEELAPDDFSAWVGGVVQDSETAERLSFVVQGGQRAPESLRTGLLEVLDAIPARRRAAGDAPDGSEFQFRSAGSLSFPSGTTAWDGGEVLAALVELDASVWFFHLVEEPWATGARAPLLDWLVARHEERLAGWIEDAVGAGLPIDKARARVQKRWRQSRIGRRVAEVTATSDDERREAGRQAVARLVRRRPEAERET